MNVKVFIANLLWFLYSVIRTRIWRRASKNVEATQNKILKEILSKNSKTMFGQKYSFEKIDCTADFQKFVPVQSYEDFKSFIDKMAAGIQNVLTTDSIQRFGVSSGSTSASKLVPYTASLVTQFQEGIDPWVYYLMRDKWQILNGKTYWSITPIGEKQKKSSGGIPIGFDDERSYFGRFTQWVLNTVMVTPSELALIQDMNVFRYATLRFLLQEKSLSWMSIWNPSFVTLFLNPLEKWFDQLIEDIRTGSMSIDLGVTPEVDASIRSNLKKSARRAYELSCIRDQKNKNLYEQVWPNLKVISCWAHGNSREAVKQLKIYFPNVVIQPKGLIATEAFVSFPFDGEASALSVTSHFFEFEEIEEKTIRLAHQLEVKKKYSVIVTTSGGLYRYRLNDVIEVLGFQGECPLICFVGKQDKVVDICGEKLNEHFVTSVVKQIFTHSNLEPKFWMMAPERLSLQDVEYTLFLQFKDDVVVGKEVLRGIAQEIDCAFRENFHYNYCRQLGQLGSCEIYVIDSECDASQTYLSTCVEMGQRLGDIKSVALHSYQYWSAKFKGYFI